MSSGRSFISMNGIAVFLAYVRVISGELHQVKDRLKDEVIGTKCTKTIVSLEWPENGGFCPYQRHFLCV
jgi:hypothetical protein